MQHLSKPKSIKNAGCHFICHILFIFIFVFFESKNQPDRTHLHTNKSQKVCARIFAVKTEKE